MTTIGSLFTGYGGLDMAVRMALDTEARIAWTSDVEPGPCRLSRQCARGGRARLSARFVEWLMGLADGYVTGEDLGLTREQQLRLLGNGVVPQQGAAAIYQLTTFALKEAA